MSRGVSSKLLLEFVIVARLLLDKAGVYEFLCDNFCGAELEGMHGKIIVLD